ncbi:MAG: PepSY domain-containing protein [Deltaproteobacteria bacterium]|nr:PepSY domain-containing protein [Deltaproteobacteria bacterium]
MRGFMPKLVLMLNVLRLAGCGPADGEPPTLPDLRPVDKADESTDGRGARYLFTRDADGRPIKVRLSPDSPRSAPPARPIPIDAAPALDFLRRNHRVLGLERAHVDALRPASLAEDEGTVVVDFDQTIDDLPALDAAVRVVYGRDGELEVAHLRPARTGPPVGAHVLDAATAAAAAGGAAGGGSLRDAPTVRAGWLTRDGSPRPAYEVELTVGDPPDSWRYVVDAIHGEVLESTSLRTDLTGRGRVWAHNAWVDSHTSLVSLPRLDDGATLRGRYVDVRDGLGPLAVGDAGRFDFPRTDRRFGEVMAYAHGDALAAYLDALGFATRRQPIVATVNAFPELNAFYDARTGGLYFGAVDGFRVADDADVILHELGHAIVDSQAPGLMRGTRDDAALHEGYADYLACSFADEPHVGEALWHEVATRLGPSETLERSGYDPRHPGRPCDSARRWPEDADTDPHVTGMIMSAALWDLRAAARRTLGRDDGRRAVDRLALTALRDLAARSNQPRDVLDALLQADRRLRLGLGEAVTAAFANHGVKTSR